MNIGNPAPFPYRLIATDLDGTLLHSDGSLSVRTAHIVAALAANRVPLVLVSARPPRILHHLAQHYGLQGTAICCNGAIVYDLVRATIVGHQPLAYALAVRVAAALKRVLPGVCFAWERGLKFGCEPAFAALHPPAAAEIRHPVDFRTLHEAPFTKLIVLDPDQPPEVLLAQARSIAGGAVTLTHSGAPFIEISAPGVDKARALRHLAYDRRIPVSSIIAFGDMPNDLPMFDLAGYAVAVANAHPRVLAQANEITGSNDDDGVAAVLERLFATGA